MPIAEKSDDNVELSKDVPPIDGLAVSPKQCSAANVDASVTNAEISGTKADIDDLPDVSTRDKADVEKKGESPVVKAVATEIDAEKENELPDIVTQNQLAQIESTLKQTKPATEVKQVPKQQSKLSFAALQKSSQPPASQQSTVQTSTQSKRLDALKSKLLNDGLLQQKPRLGGGNFDTINFDSDDDDGGGDDEKPELPGKELFTRFLAHSKKQPKKEKKHVVKMKILRKEPTLTSEDSQSQQFNEALKIQVGTGMNNE